MDLVQLKGYRGGLRVVIDQEAPLSDVESAIVEKLANLGDYITGISITLDAGDRPLSDDDIRRIQNVLTREFDVTIERIIATSNKTQRLADVLKIPTVEKAEQAEEPIGETLSKFVPPNARLVKSTLRAGQEERFLEGSVVIMGDVNPGADVIASGDIIILGSLRGRAFAGALGDRDAVIIALNFDPIQIRIADRISARPDRGTIGRWARARSGVEIARVEGDMIVVSDYKSKKST